MKRNRLFHILVSVGYYEDKSIRWRELLTCDYQQLPHLGIRTLQPYIPGKPVNELARELGLTDIIKLASNENPLGCSQMVLKTLAGMSGQLIAAYPAPSIHPVKNKLSQKLSIGEDQLTLGNGSDFIFTLLLTAFGLHNNKHILTHDQAFLTYSVQAKTLGIPLVSTPLMTNWEVDIPAMIKACNQDTSLIFLANPNNPTGLLIPHERIRQLLKTVPKTTIVVIDEAYYEFAYPTGDRLTLTLVEEFPNAVITRTFSKAYGLAGLRLGYAISSREICELLQRVQLPFSVNQAALEAAFVALDDDEFLAQTLEINHIGLQQMRTGLEALNLFALPSDCNFITFDCGMNAIPVYQDLLAKGIIVRPLTQYGLPNFLRVSIGKPEQNSRFLEQLSIIISKKNN
jgi:histidinol-phosphate aminotransferase